MADSPPYWNMLLGAPKSISLKPYLLSNLPPTSIHEKKEENSETTSAWLNQWALPLTPITFTTLGNHQAGIRVWPATSYNMEVSLMFACPKRPPGANRGTAIFSRPVLKVPRRPLPYKIIPAKKPNSKFWAPRFLAQWWDTDMRYPRMR